MEVRLSDPLAYFISFACYGCRLHGDDRGSVDLRHNLYGTPVLPPDSEPRGVLGGRP